MTTIDERAGPGLGGLDEEAQREADTVFAQYQLSQLLALGGDLRTMAASVLRELVRVTDAGAGALWLSPPGVDLLRLAAVESVDDPVDCPDIPGSDPPSRFMNVAGAAGWARMAGWHGVPLEERRGLDRGPEEGLIVGFIAFCPPAGGQLPADGVRLLALVSHELAIALQAAQLREALEAEQALLAAILDGASDGIVAVDEQCRVVRVNRAALELLGNTPVRPRSRSCRELLGCARKGPHDGEPERLRCGPRCRFAEVLEHGLDLSTREQTVLARDGTEIPVAAAYAATPGPELGAVVVLRDLRADLAVEELRASFLAAVSHELRTPLSLISGHVDSILALDLDADAQRRSVERIGLAADRLAELVAELLELTRFETSGPALQRSIVHLPSVLERLADDLAESPGMRPVRVAIPPDLPAVEVDALRIGHVLANLVDNAQKYGGLGPITVTARQDGGMVVVSVHDTGGGVPPEERQQVFDRFYRGRNARDGGPAGSGLGLYVCRRLVEAHGGRIWIESEPGGSAVSFSLPMPSTARSHAAPAASFPVRRGAAR